MTNKCRRRMNRGERYIAIEIAQRKKERKKRGRKKGGRKRLLGSERSWGFTSSNEDSFLPGK